MSNSNNFSVPLLNKLIQLLSLDSICLDSLTKLVMDPDLFKNELSVFEQALAQRSPSEPPPEATDGSINDHLGELAEIVAASMPLRRLFLDAPRFSQVDPDTLIITARFADAKPDRESVLKSEDRPFMRVLRADRRLAETTVDQLLREDIALLTELYTSYLPIFETVHKLALTEKWSTQILAVESVLVAVSSELPKGNLPLNDSMRREMASAIEKAGLDDEMTQRLLQVLHSMQLNELNQALFTQIMEDEALDNLGIEILMAILEFDHAQQPNLLRLLLHRKLRLSDMLAKEVISIWKIRSLISDAIKQKSEAQHTNSPISRESTRIAGEILANRLLHTDDEQRLRKELDIRLNAVRHFLRLRKIAKVDAFRYRWPALAQHLQTDRTAIAALESKAIEYSMELEPLPERWRGYFQDEGLMRFLRLRPLFSDIYPNELGQLLKSSQTFSPTSTINQPFDTASDLELTTTGSSDTESTSSHASLKSIKNDAASTLLTDLEYDNIHIRIDQDKNEPDTYQVTLEQESDKKNRSRVGRVSIYGDEVDQVLNQYEFDSGSASFTRRATSRGQMDQADITRDMGIWIADTFLGAEIKTELFVRLSEEQKRFRIFFDFDDSRLTQVPWETLYAPFMRTQLGLTHKYSLIRYVSKDRPIP